jgi:outer membrane lipoprotein-sorting protein
MAGRSRLLIGTLVLGVFGVTSLALAQGVPLPTPAPLPKEGVPPARTGTQQQQPAAQSGPFSGIKSLFNFGQEATPAAPAAAPAATSAAFDAKQKAQVDRVSQYLTSVQTLTGTFVQVGPDGGRVRGTFYIQKPGKVRFEYDPPTPIDIIADGKSVVVRDRKLATQDLYPLSQTPLRFLLADRIDLLKDTTVVGVKSDDVFVTVVIEERQPIVGTSRLMMMVGAKDYQLKQWTVTDPQGYDTTVAVSNLDTKARMNPDMFVINYNRDIGRNQ